MFRTILRTILLTIAFLYWLSPSMAASPEDILRVNAFWNNNVSYGDDVALKGKDHWQGPGETWKRKTGDCDDYAIAKYYTLLSMGVPEKDVELVSVVYDTGYNDPMLHVVVLVTDSRGVWVLDSAVPEIMKLEQRHDIITKFATYGKSGVKWHQAVPKQANTPAMWSAMKANHAKHIADARAAYNQRPITITWVR